MVNSPRAGSLEEAASPRPGRAERGRTTNKTTSAEFTHEDPPGRTGARPIVVISGGHAAGSFRMRLAGCPSIWKEVTPRRARDVGFPRTPKPQMRLRWEAAHLPPPLECPAHRSDGLRHPGF